MPIAKSRPAHAPVIAQGTASGQAGLGQAGGRASPTVLPALDRSPLETTPTSLRSVVLCTTGSPVTDVSMVCASRQGTGRKLWAAAHRTSAASKPVALVCSAPAVTTRHASHAIFKTLSNVACQQSACPATCHSLLAMLHTEGRTRISIQQNLRAASALVGPHWVQCSAMQCSVRR